jgi:hypothetical protein
VALTGSWQPPSGTAMRRPERKTRITLPRFRAAIGVIAVAAACPRALGQQLEPRAYSNLPVGLNFLVAGYSYFDGAVVSESSVNVDNAHLTAHGTVLAYARALAVGGKSAKFDIILPSASVSGTADVNGVQQQRQIAGLGDPSMRFTYNFYGAPALKPRDFARYKQDLILGASLQVTAPFGQYDPSRLVNIGANRWAIKPEIGMSKRSGTYVFELTASAAFSTENTHFLGGKTLTRDTVYAFQGNVIDYLPHGQWFALGATHYFGGRTTIDGVPRDDELANWRVGFVVGLPIDRQNSIKLTATSGVAVRTGTDFKTIGIAWQYRWGGGVK